MSNVKELEVENSHLKQQILELQAKNSYYEEQFRLMLKKKYFDKGYGLTHYLFKLIAVFGLTSSKLQETFIALIIYTLLCFVLGYFWLKYNLYNAELEVDNQFNPFQQELRKKLNIPKSI